MALFEEYLPRITGTIRIINAAPGLGPIDVYSNGENLAKNLTFGGYTTYLPVPSSTNNIQLYKAGEYDDPLLSETIEVTPNSISTLSVILLEGSIQIFTLKDGSPSTNVDESFLRFINLSPDSPLLSLSLTNGDTLFNGVEYLESTGYYPLNLGIYDFQIEATSAVALNKIIKDKTLQGGYFHTLYIVGLFEGKPTVGSLYLQDGFPAK